MYGGREATDRAKLRGTHTHTHAHTRTHTHARTHNTNLGGDALEEVRGDDCPREHVGNEAAPGHACTHRHKSIKKIRVGMQRHKVCVKEKQPHTHTHKYAHTHTHTQVCTHTSMHTHARTSTQRATVAADFMLLTRRKKEQERKEEEEEERTSTGKGTSCLAAPAVNRLSFLGADQTTWWSWRGQRWRR